MENYTVTETLTDRDRSELYERLLEYNLARIEDKNPKELGIFHHNDNGEKTAGLIGSTHGNWLEVDYLWVSEALRGKGIGSEILRVAEETAKSRGCKYVFLNTFGFQAPGFYEKHGYELKFVLTEYPLSGKRYYYTKTLCDMPDK